MKEQFVKSKYCIHIFKGLGFFPTTNYQVFFRKLILYCDKCGPNLITCFASKLQNCSGFISYFDDKYKRCKE